MANRFGMARKLVERAEGSLVKLKGLYKEALENNDDLIDAQVDVKTTLEHLRSALDYCATELFERFGQAKGKPNVYFPIAKLGSRPEDFDSLIQQQIPGLIKSRPDIAKLLTSFQWFSYDRYGDPRSKHWLPDLADFANQNKHVHLMPQEPYTDHLPQNV